MFFLSTVKKFYQKFIFKRCDDVGTARYFSSEDFEGLSCEPYSFKNSAGETLQGCFYNYDNPIEGRLIIFDHGIGGGHLSYMKEIELLARHGYKVFSYDHTGCMKSGGDSCVGFTQSLSDLDNCLKTLKSDERFKTAKFAVMGHSWGGFAALNISAFHPDLTHIVVFSGFVSVSTIAESFGAFKKYIYEAEKQSNPKYVDCNASESLKNTNAKLVFVYSDNDKLVKKDKHYDALKSAFGKRENTYFLLEEGKGHNPNYTVDAVNYLAEYMQALSKNKSKLKTDEQKKLFTDSFDWDRMTKQDENVWQKIFEVLDK